MGEHKPKQRPPGQYTKHYSVPVFARAAIIQILMPGPLELNRIRTELAACEIHLANGSLYPALRALVEDKLLREVEVEDARTPGYALTEKGRGEAIKHRLTLMELLRRSALPKTQTKGPSSNG